MSTRKRGRKPARGPQRPVTFYRPRKQPEAPQPAPEASPAPSTLRPSDLTRGERRLAVLIALHLFSERAAAPDLDPHTWSEKGTPESTLDLYGRLWDQVGRLGFDRRDILAPQEVEERIDRALVADLLEDIDLSGFAA